MTSTVTAPAAPSIKLNCKNRDRTKLEFCMQSDRVVCTFFIKLTADGDILVHVDSFDCSELPGLIELLEEGSEPYSNAGVKVASKAKSGLSIFCTEGEFFAGFHTLGDEEDVYTGVSIKEGDVPRLIQFFKQAATYGADAAAANSAAATSEEALVPRLGLI